jgi:AbrB family looped-hinge helix DNA binding protein
MRYVLAEVEFRLSNIPTSMTTKQAKSAVVRVKGKFQVTIPPSVRAELGLTVGDLLEAQVRNGKITLTPKSMVDRELALAMKEYREGRFIGPFKTAEAAIRALRRGKR